MTVVTVHTHLIERFFERRTLSGASTVSPDSTANRVAARIVRQAVANASGEVVRERDGNLKNSVVKIVRPSARSGAIEIGVGTTLKYGAVLEVGGEPHLIRAVNRPFLVSAPNNPTPLRKRGLREVPHPGPTAKKWLSQAVFSVTGRQPNVRTFGV